MAKGYKADGTPVSIGNKRAKLPDGEAKKQKSVSVLPKHLKHFGARFNSVVFALVDELYNKEIAEIHPQN